MQLGTNLAMDVISIGDQVREGTYRLHSCFRRAVNFTDGRRLVTLVTPDIGAGPVNVVVQDFADLPGQLDQSRRSHQSGQSDQWDLWDQWDLSDKSSLSGKSGLSDQSDPSDMSASAAVDKPDTSTPQSFSAHPVLQVSRYSVVFANRRFLLNSAQSYGSLLHIEKETSLGVFRKNLTIVENILTKNSHPKSLAFLLDEKREQNFHTTFDQVFMTRIKDGAERMFSAAGVRRLAGCGFGLTPSGDDFIAGMLVGLNVLRACSGRRPRRHRLHAPGDGRRYIHAIYTAAAGKNLLSNSFLKLARDGRVSEKMQKLISSLFCHEDAEVRERTEEVMAAGETSGADLLTGFVMTVKSNYSG